MVNLYHGVLLGCGFTAADEKIIVFNLQYADKYI